MHNRKAHPYPHPQCKNFNKNGSSEQARTKKKTKYFNVDLKSATMGNDAFFPFDDRVKIEHTAGINAFIQPGVSIRDKDSIEYCKAKNLAMVITGLRHFKH